MDFVDAAVEQYATEHTSPVPGQLSDVAAATKEAHDDHHMMVGRLVGELLAMIVHATRPTLVVEIGTFTGYSALSMAEVLAPGGRVVTCEVDPEHAAYARRHFEASPFGDRIELREGPALETLASLEGPIDLGFIDADKENYVGYYEAILGKLSPTGLIVADNTLWSGRVADPSDTSERTLAMRNFNDHVAGDSRVRCVQLTVRDGVTLIRPVAGRRGGRDPGQLE